MKPGRDRFLAAWAVGFAVLFGATIGCDRDQAQARKSLPPPNRPTASRDPKPKATDRDRSVSKADSKAKGSARFRVEPERIRLEPGDDGAQLIAESLDKDGAIRDLTESVRWETEPEGIVSVGDDGYVRPLKPGEAKVLAIRGFDRVEIAVESVGGERSWDFAADLVPILTRAGCNAGGCHGKADGQNGFHLSLFGYDPEGDYRAIVQDSGGRRISAIDPENSLFLLKGAGRIPHAGGPRLAPASAEYETVVAWLNAGRPVRRGKPKGAVKELVVSPSRTRLDQPGPRRLRAIARFENGGRRDVTRLALYRLNDDHAASIEPTGRVELLGRAEVDVIVRYGSHVVSTRVAAVVNPGLRLDFAKLPRRNFIDDELFKRLADLRVPPSPRADDSTFLRRVTLDLIGRQPLPEEIREFRKDPDPDKRLKKVDELLKNRDFVRFWQIKFGDLLQIGSARFGDGVGAYQYWLTDRLLKNEPWDAMVRELLTSLGNPYDLKTGGAINYALDGADPQTQAELTAQRFLGLRIRCAQCHDHPFDVWTQDDYYGLAAFFAKVDRGVGPAGMMGRLVVKVNPRGNVVHLRTKQVVPPRLPKGPVLKLPEDEDPRKALAAWMTAKDNPYFARASANWVWAQFFGKGLADPADDLGRSNPPVHPELLDALANFFVKSGYDLRALIRAVATSEAYGLSSATVSGNERDSRFFSHQTPRPLTAHQMADVLAEVTDVPNRFGRLGVRRAIEVNDPATPSAILDAFGRCPRQNGCSTVASPSLSLRQALLLIGGGLVDEKVSHPRGYLASLLDQDPAPSPEEIVENLYLRTLCRPPVDEELSHWTRELKTAADPRDAAEDLFWALLNSKEFAFNH